MTHKTYTLKTNLKDPNAHDIDFVKAYKDRASGSLSRLERQGAASILA